MSNEDFATEIASVIEANIKNRTYPYGAPLPSERELSEKFSEVTHKYRLYSLDNSNNYEDLKKWYERVKKEFPNEKEVDLVA